LLVVDTGWLCCGAASEILAQVTERLQGRQQVRIGRMGYAPVTCPTTPPLEELFYPNARTIAATARDLVEGQKAGWLPDERPELQGIEFKGPF
jgi:pyruvate dehydrogenase E1 component beta subunit